MEGKKTYCENAMKLELFEGQKKEVDRNIKIRVINRCCVEYLVGSDRDFRNYIKGNQKLRKYVGGRVN